jgi:hypothetical protein
MKRLTVLALAFVLTGCASMTPNQKKAAAVVSGALVVGAVLAHDSDKGSAVIAPPAGPPCHAQPDGSCR